MKIRKPLLLLLALPVLLAGGKAPTTDKYTLQVSDPNRDGKKIGTKLVGKEFLLRLAVLKNGQPDVNTNGEQKVWVSIYPTTQPGCPVDQGMKLPNSITVTFKNGVSSLPLTISTAYRQMWIYAKLDGQDRDGCSKDSFVVRPATFTVRASTTNGTLLNNALEGTPGLAAGKEFQLTIAAAPGYDGHPETDFKIDFSKFVDHREKGIISSPSKDTDRLTVITAVDEAKPVSGEATGKFRYDDVATFSVKAKAVTDNNFTKVDRDNDDCVKDDASSTPNKNGLYGCDIENLTDSGPIGRFFPDHYLLSSADAKSTCTANCPGNGAVCLNTPPPPSTPPATPAPCDKATHFSYRGQSNIQFSYTITAQSANGRTTPSYDNKSSPTYSFVRKVKLVAGTRQGQQLDTLPAAINEAWLTPTWEKGVLTVKENEAQSIGISRRLSPPPSALITEVPQAAVLAIRVDDPDGAALGDLDFTPGAANCGTDNPCQYKALNAAAPLCILHGRLRVPDAYSPDNKDLNIPVITEYCAKTSNNACVQWQRNLFDACTSLSAANITAGSFQPAGAAEVIGKPFHFGAKKQHTGTANTGSYASELNPASFLLLPKPTKATIGKWRARVTVDLCKNLPHLQETWGGTSDCREVDNPSGTVTFGSYRNNRNIIIRREQF